MNGARGFLGTIVFGAAVALCWLACERLLGARAGLAVTGVAAAALYAACLGTGLRERWRAGALAGGLSALAWLLAPSATFAAAGAGLAIAVARSSVVGARGAARSLAVEIALGLASLACVRALAGPTSESIALAFWGFFLVQSAFFLVGGIERRRRQPARDPFEVAHREVLRLLERPPGLSDTDLSRS